MKTKPLKPLAARCIASGRSSSDSPVIAICETFDALEGTDFASLSDTDRRLLFDVSLVVARNDLNGKSARGADIVGELIATYGAETLLPDMLEKTMQARAS